MYKTVELEIKTNKKDEMIDITDRIKQIIENRNIESGIVTLFVPHTTAAVTINEAADPDVKTDILFGLDKVYPYHNEFKHFEGNSPAHLKASSFGSSETLIIEDKKIILGTWQGIYFCEFDGPRTRKLFVKILTD